MVLAHLSSDEVVDQGAKVTNLGSYEDAYRKLAEGSGSWMASAQNLLASADLLWATVAADLNRPGRRSDDGGHHADVAANPEPPHSFLQRGQHAATFLMIAGLAVENALKAVVVQRERPGATQEGQRGLRIGPALQTHDLRKLASNAGILLDAADDALLDRLRTYLEWAARYPIATTSPGHAVVQNIWGSDRAKISNLFTKLRAALDGDRTAGRATTEQGLPVDR